VNDQPETTPRRRPRQHWSTIWLLCMILTIVVIVVHHAWSQVDEAIYSPYVLTGIVLGIILLIILLRRPWQGSQSFERPLPRVDQRYRGVDDQTRKIVITQVNDQRKLVWYSLNGVHQRSLNASEFFDHYEPDSSAWFTIVFVVVGTLAVAVLASTEFGGPTYHDVIDWLRRAADTFLDQFSGLPGIRQMR